MGSGNSTEERKGLNDFKTIFCAVRYDDGKTMGKNFVFTVPMLLGNIAQQLYNTVDSIVVGRYVGDNALAAVGSASPIYNLLLVLFMGVSVGPALWFHSILEPEKERNYRRR